MSVGEITGAVEELGGRLVRWARYGPDGADGDDTDAAALPPVVLPPVVLLSGCTLPSTVWQPVLPGLAAHEVVLLDRPGLRATPWPGTIPTLAAEVATVVALIERLGRPAIIVGHSMAGLHAEAVARSRPELVHGLVLVDGSVESRIRRPLRDEFWLALAGVARRGLRTRALAVASARISRFLVQVQSKRPPRSILDELEAAYRRPEVVAASIAEYGAYRKQIVELAALRGDREFPDRPVEVLCATGDLWPGWANTQARLAELLHGTQRVLPQSRHLTMFDAPEEIVAAVQRIGRATH